MKKALAVVLVAFIGLGGMIDAAEAKKRGGSKKSKSAPRIHLHVKAPSSGKSAGAADRGYAAKSSRDVSSRSTSSSPPAGFEFPNGAVAMCRNGEFASAGGSGTCRGQGGVRHWKP